MKKLTKEEFIEREALRSDVTVEYFKKHLDAVPCDCGHSVCPGWLSVDRVTYQPKELRKRRKVRLAK